MKPAVIVGVILIVLGAVALAYQGITYTSQEKVVDLGPLKVEAKKEKTIPLPPLLGAPAAGRRGGPGRGQRPEVASARLKARLQAGLHARPLVLQDREVHRVALIAADVHVLAQHALAHRAQPGDGLLRAHVAAVRLERDPDAAQALEAVARGTGTSTRCWPACASSRGQEGRADLDLPVGAAARRAGASSRSPAPVAFQTWAKTIDWPLGHQLARLPDEASASPRAWSAAARPDSGRPPRPASRRRDRARDAPRSARG